MYDLLLTSGHGGIDPGAVGSKYTEHELVVKINTELARQIELKCKASVCIINEKNDNGQFLNSYPAAMMWHSSHLNGANDKEANGSEAIIDNNSGAKQLLNNILNILANYGFKNRGIKNNEQLYVLNYDELLNKDCNHILEWGFVTNDEDVERLLNNLTAICEKVADAYIDYYGWELKSEPKKEKEDLMHIKYNKVEKVEITRGGSYLANAEMKNGLFTGKFTTIGESKTKKGNKFDTIMITTKEGAEKGDTRVRMIVSGGHAGKLIFSRYKGKNKCKVIK